jgi:hypothetical protein
MGWPDWLGRVNLKEPDYSQAIAFRQALRTGKNRRMRPQSTLPIPTIPMGRRGNKGCGCGGESKQAKKRGKLVMSEAVGELGQRSLLSGVHFAHQLRDVSAAAFLFVFEVCRHRPTVTFREAGEALF